MVNLTQSHHIASVTEAELLAIRALSWLAEEPDDLGAFSVHSGVEPAAFAHMARSRPFLVALLEFLTSDDARVLRFAAWSACDPMAPLEALRHLQGRSATHWT